MLSLRPYQQAAVDAVYQHLRAKDTNPCVVAPTGSGKSWLLAKIAKDAVTLWNGRVLVLAHVKELLEQNADKIRRLCPDVKVGIYSAGLNSRDTADRIIVAGIQSVYTKAEQLGSFDLILVDEAHTIPESGEGRYRTFLSAMKGVNPNVRLIGLTATPFRTGSGLICKPENLLNEVCYDISVRLLIDDGYLSKLRGKSSKDSVNTDGLRIRAGEFEDAETEVLMNTEDVVRLACADILKRTEDRKSVIVFCCSVSHAMNVQAELGKFAPDVRIITGETPKDERASTLADFKVGAFKYLVNVNVLTTGFDAPNIDCVVLLRPTASPGLYAQMVGRGLRICEGKTDCLILDFGNNILRHGPIDAIEVAPVGEKPKKTVKVCPACDETLPIATKLCPICGHEFKRPPVLEKPPHQARESGGSILSDGKAHREALPVMSVAYRVHTKRDAPPDAPRTVCVTYCTGLRFYSEWLCPEHTGYAREKFEAWWKVHAPHCAMPSTAEECVWFGNERLITTPLSITVKTVPNESFPRIVGYELPKEEITEEDDLPF